MIAAYVGAPGDCKTYSLVDWLVGEQRHGRLTMSQFAVNGAWPLSRLVSLLHDSNRGAAVGIDEIARILPARDWTHEDDVESAVFETHRHQGLDIRYCMQDTMQASASLRRLTNWYIFCFRIGSDPSSLIKAGKEPRWWQCPLAVKQVWVHKDDIGSDGKPKPPDHRGEYKTRYIWWRRSIARLYDTTERIYTEGLQEDIESRLANYSEQRSLETPWSVIDGHAIGTLTRLYRARDDQALRRQRRRTKPPAGGGDLDISQEDIRGLLQGNPPSPVSPEDRYPPEPV